MPDLTPPTPRGVYDVEATAVQHAEVVALADMLRSVSAAYFKAVPPSARSDKGWASYMADHVHRQLPDIGYHCVTRPTDTVQPLVDWGVRTPHGVAGATDRTHAEEVAARSTAGAHAVWRVVGPWRDDPAPV